MKPNERVKWITASKDKDELIDRYDRWAATYDTDLKNAYGWVGPQQSVQIFRQLVPDHARVFDAGAGTGLVGQALAACGYADIVAADLSAAMLEEARKKDVYTAYHQVILGETLPFENDSFDAVISVGVLTQGHAPASSFDELIRITRPGGHIIFTLRTDVYEQNGFREKLTDLENKHVWKLARLSEPFQALPRGEPDLHHRVWGYRVF